MILINKGFILFLGSVAAFAFTLEVAASEGGAGSTGGGNAIACVQPVSGRSLELLDYYEAQLTTNLKIDLGPDTGNYHDRIEFVLNRLAKIDPETAKRFREKAQTFESEVKFIPGAQIKAFADSFEPVNPPPGCNKEQFAIQFFEPKPNQPRYLVNQDLWKAADSETRAGLVLHELNYRDAWEAGQKSSDNARYMNAQMSASGFENLSPDDYISRLTAAGLCAGHSVFRDTVPVFACESAELVYIPADLAPMTYSSQGKVWSLSGGLARFSADWKLSGAYVDASASIDDLSFPLQRVWIDVTSGQFDLRRSSSYPVSEDTNGHFPTVTISGQMLREVSWIGLSGSRDHIQKIDAEAAQIGSNRFQTPVSVALSERRILSLTGKVTQGVRIGNQSIVGDLSKGITFFESGEIETLTVAQDTPLKVGTDLISVPAGTSVRFWPEGAVRKVRNNSTQFSLWVKLGEVQMESRSVTWFYPSGKVAAVNLVRNASVPTAQGEIEIAPEPHSWLTQFYENGNLKLGYIPTVGIQEIIVGKKKAKLEGDGFFSNMAVFYPDGRLASGFVSEMTDKSFHDVCQKLGFFTEEGLIAHDIYTESGIKCMISGGSVYDPSSNKDPFATSVDDDSLWDPEPLFEQLNSAKS